MFQKGDRVRMVEGRTTPGIGAGEIDLVVEAGVGSDGHEILLKNHKAAEGYRFYDEYFQLVEERKETKHQEYTVRVTCPGLLDTEDVYKELSRDNPLAIIKGDDGTVQVVIHISIYRKTNFMDNIYANNLREAVRQLERNCMLADGKLSAVVDAVKKIRYGKIKEEYKNPTEYTVTIPEM